ncbi:MAG: hypothetical protein JW795_00500 [Chitinivibrionales bacterium]|nr:hypothetical protein [Chitinivibrionales bacterium]
MDFSRTATPETAALAQEPAVHSFHTSENTTTKRKILLSLFDEISEQVQLPTPQWKIELLREALNSKNPLIVETAARLIPFTNDPVLYRETVQKFRGADTLFGAYADRVRVSLIAPLCAYKSKETTRALVDFLSLDNGSDIAVDVLQAVQRIGDVSLLPAVREYCQKMQLLAFHLRSHNSDPLQFGRYQMYAQCATTVEQSLREVLENEQNGSIGY